MKTTIRHSLNQPTSRHGSFLIALAIAAAALTLSPVSPAVQPRGRAVYETAKLTASDGAQLEEFGSSVSISGNLALVGAFGDQEDKGAAYIFAFDGTTWSEQAKLTASDGAADALFGYSVALSGNVALVGAYGYRADGTEGIVNDNGESSPCVVCFQGAAYVFTFDGSTWTEQAKLTPSDPGNHWFGRSVALAGNVALVGAPANENDTQPAAYVFVFDGMTWNQQAKLMPDDGFTGDGFGDVVSLSGQRALIGSVTRYPDPGAAYVFMSDGTTWTQEAKLTALDGTYSDFFGTSVSLSGDRAMVGAPYDDANGTRTGSAYVFKFDGATWSQEAKLLASDSHRNGLFASAVRLSGANALIGAPQFEFGPGRVYVFSLSQNVWTERGIMLASTGASGDILGYDISISGKTAIVGASLADSNNGINTGAAYIFPLGRQ